MGRAALRFAVWGAAVAGAVWLYMDGHAPGALPGAVESPGCVARPVIGGQIASISTATGDKIQAGAVLAKLHPGELVRELELMEARLESAESALNDERQRLGLARDERTLALRGEALALQRSAQEQQAAVVADQTEVSRLDDEIKRLEDALGAGLGRSEALSGLKRRRDVLARRLGGLRSALVIARNQHKTASEALEAWTQSDPAPAIRALLAPRADDVEAVRQDVLALRQRLASHRIEAPCEGRAAEILVPQGASVAAFEPILNIEGDTARFVDAWTPESTAKPPQVGSSATIVAPFRGVEASGRVVSISPGLSQLPVRLTPTAEPLWGQRLRIELDADHGLMPGERVDVTLSGGAP